MTMRVCILGAGSLGCAIGGALALSGADVVLVNHNAEHVDAINRDGLKITDGTNGHTVAVRAAVDCADIAPVDLLVVLVKSFDTVAAIEAARSLVAAQTTVLSLQNGLGHEDIIANAVGRAPIIAGKSYVGGMMLGPGRVLAGLRDKRTLIGELDGSVTPRITRISDAFNRAGLTTAISTNIIGVVWDKLLVNAATGALSGITRLPYGALYSMPEVRACALAAVTEGIAVAEASGVSISIHDPVEAWNMAGAGLPYEFKPSILQSLEKGSRTEIDFINGALVREGAQCGVATPVNATLVAAIKGIEYGIAQARVHQVPWR